MAARAFFAPRDRRPVSASPLDRIKNVTRTLFSLGVVGLLAVLVAGMQNDPMEQELAQIRHAIADIGLRVSRLEHADGVPAGPIDPGSPPSAGLPVARSIVVVGIQTADNPPPNQDQINDLQDDIDALQKNVTFHENQLDRVAGGTYYAGGYYSGGHYGYNHSVNGRNNQETAQRDMANRYATQLSIKKEQLDKLQQAATQPLQIIHGHDGDVIFTLRTKVNLSRALKKINIGDTVTWRGERDSADDNSETWLISSIRKIERP